MDGTKIEWTDATWNPVSGCTQISPGCDNCYAMAIAEGQRGTRAFPNGFDITFRPHKLDDPVRWREPRMIFVNSMSDMFHEDIPDEYILRMIEVMHRAPQHVYQILTKRPGRAQRLAEYFLDVDGEWPVNIWLGVSVESADYITRAAVLKKIPAVIRFLSCEPLLGPLDLDPVLADGSIRWVITGGESGRGRRVGEYDWFRQIRAACQRYGVAWFHKQGYATRSGQDRELDGRTWDEYPDTRQREATLW